MTIKLGYQPLFTSTLFIHNLFTTSYTMFFLKPSFTGLVLVAQLLSSATAAKSSKKGLVFTSATDLQPFASSISWAYNYGTSSSGPVPNGIEYVPMYRSPATTQASVQSAINAGAQHLLGYNEPDEPVANGGTSLSPADAAARWRSSIAPFSTSVQLGSPAVISFSSTSGPTGGPSGLDWLAQFVAAGQGQLHIQFACLHWEGASGQSATDQANAFLDYIATASQRVNSIFGRTVPIWVTEFAPAPLNDPQTAATFLKAVLPALEANSAVARYSYYDAEQLASGGQLNAAGQVYISG